MKKVKKTKSKPAWYERQISFGSVKYEDIVTAAKNLSVMLGAGLTVSESLAVLVEQLRAGKLKSVLSKIAGKVEAGESFGSALGEHEKIFGAVLVHAVRVGENGGTLAENLKHAAEQLEKDLRVKRNIHSAMMYPIVVLVAAGALGLALATFVLPQMVQVFDSLGGSLPITTRILIWVADIFGRYGMIISPLIVLAIIFLVWLLRQKWMRPWVHPIILHLPVLGIFSHEINRARFCRSVGSLLEAGVPIQEALKICGDILPNFVYASSVRSIYEQIASGQGFSELLTKYPKLYPKMIQRMIAVGEESGKMGESLLYLADFFEEKVEIRAKNLATLIEPILLLFIGAIVAFIALSILTPIYSITERVSM